MEANQETQVTETAASQEVNEKKPRLPRRVAKLVIGRWCHPGGPQTGPDVFVPADLQPTGRAQREIEALKAWLKQPATAKTLLEQGVTSVRAIREELLEASFVETRVLKTAVK